MKPEAHFGLIPSSGLANKSICACQVELKAMKKPWPLKDKPETLRINPTSSPRAIEG
jgi:hypothetical protein